MDSTRAQQLADTLIGTTVAGWSLTEFKGYGKSAVVFSGIKDGNTGAVKIFDTELVNRYGKDDQLNRINRELDLVGHGNNNLIQILDGGNCPDTDYLYLVMELLDWPSLDEVISDIPNDKIWILIEQIANAAEFLETKNIAHRDIKPSNIIVSPDFSEAKLLDLGVLRPIGGSDLTDLEQKIFIGTLQYASPEFLVRKEEDTTEGWRAITFYQLGGVLHDCIMKKDLFGEYINPYPSLVHAVAEEIPIIESDAVEPELILLARNCLSKNPEQRINLVSWDDFKQRHPDTSETVILKHRITQRQKASLTPDEQLQQENENRVKSNKVSEILNEVYGITKSLRTRDYLPSCIVKTQSEPENNCGLLFMNLRKSDRFAIPVEFSIYLNFIIMNPEENVLKICCSAIAGSEIGTQDFDNEQLTCFYEGVFEKGVYTERLEHIILTILDTIQQINPEDHQKQSINITLLEQAK